MARSPVPLTIIILKPLAYHSTVCVPVDTVPPYSTVSHGLPSGLVLGIGMSSFLQMRKLRLREDKDVSNTSKTGC